MNTTTIHDIQIIEIPRIHDVRGNLSVLEGDMPPFDIKRVYYLYDVPSDSSRGGHAHKVLEQFLIATSGSFDVIIKDGSDQKTITLNKPYLGLLLPSGIWRELDNFSSGSVCMVIASEVYQEDDYIRDFKDFTLYKSHDS